MLHELEISRFRCFEHFVARDLTRLNLVVGKNNAGKTCFLEALAVIADGGPGPLARALKARGELVHVDLAEEGVKAVAAEARHAFHGHTLAPGTGFSLRSEGDRAQDRRRVEVIHSELKAHLGEETALEKVSAAPFGRRPPLPVAPPIGALKWELVVGDDFEAFLVPIGPEGRMEGAAHLSREIARLPVRLIRTDLGDRDDIAELWTPIAATEHEDGVVELLRVVEPGIEKIAATPGPGGGIFVRLRGTRERVPLGSFGEGTTRLFSLACNLISVQHGLLLIDEIDTGLHVSTMTAMWRFLARAAERLDVQIFATTHSDDCIRGLADFLRGDPGAAAWTKLYRIERGAQTMTEYHADQIIDTADANIEVR